VVVPPPYLSPTTTAGLPRTMPRLMGARLPGQAGAVELLNHGDQPDLAMSSTSVRPSLHGHQRLMMPRLV
jgi:hypothetical protein